ncbi:MAG: hypothetical protein Q7R95_08935 [bacterium]|nr:hypothetical protein [bacterium]
MYNVSTNKAQKIIIIVLIILAVAFYWYGIRPAQIRKNCHKKVWDDPSLVLTTNFERNQLGGDMNKINKAEREKADYWYKDCLNENGLKE